MRTAAALKNIKTEKARIRAENEKYGAFAPGNTDFYSREAQAAEIDRNARREQGYGSAEYALGLPNRRDWRFGK